MSMINSAVSHWGDSWAREWWSGSDGVVMVRTTYHRSVCDAAQWENSPAMARILIVDDRAINRRYVAQVLQLEGHEIFEAEQGEAALALATDRRPDLVITDLVMPVMDGIELTRRLRLARGLEHTKVMFFSAAYRPHAAHSAELGVSVVLSKPAEPQAIRHAVRRALEDGTTRERETATDVAPATRERLLEGRPATDRGSANVYGLLELALDLALERDLGAFLDLFCEGGRRIVGASAAALVLLDADGRGVRSVNASGLDEDTTRALRECPPQIDLWHGHWSSSGPIRLDDSAQPVGLPHALASATDLLVSPIGPVSGCQGVLLLVKGMDAFGKEEETLAAALAAQFSVLFELFEANEALKSRAEQLQAEVAQRRRAEHELSAFAQRLLDQEKETARRLALALHDELGQTLAALRLTLDAWLARDGTDPAREALMDRIDQLAGDANRQVRQTLMQLRPPLLDELGLASALDNDLKSRPEGAPGVDIRFEARPSARRLRWPAEVEYAAFMVAREAVGNALRHARASRVLVSLSGDEHHLELEVSDNGVGLPWPADRPSIGHLGLVGMRERALAIAAALSFDTPPDGGTRVRLRWPDEREPGSQGGL
jgi:signal transduction histidine kinase/CheY-like chemotaxis protein